VQRSIAWYADRRAPGARTSAIARTAYIDEAVKRALARGIGQLVILGAGFDCRAHRIEELAHVKVFEVDRAATQAEKRARVPAGGVRYVPVDFLREDAFAKLTDFGWQRSEPSLFIWEGVTNYLTEDAVTRVLAEVGRCATGTTIVFTYIHKGVLDRSTVFAGADLMLKNVQQLGEPWTFGIEPSQLATFLAAHGLTLRDDAGADDYRARYLGTGSRGYGFYRIAIAEKT
jgi:methyltransferase (TIGR00027 family)